MCTPFQSQKLACPILIKRTSLQPEHVLWPIRRVEHFYLVFITFGFQGINYCFPHVWSQLSKNSLIFQECLSIFEILAKLALNGGILSNCVWQHWAEHVSSTSTLSIMTYRIMTLNIMTLSIMTYSIMTLNTMTLSMMTPSIMGLLATLSINDTQYIRHTV